MTVESVAQDYAVLFHNLPCRNNKSEQLVHLWMPNQTAGEESLSGHGMAFVNLLELLVALLFHLYHHKHHFHVKW